MLDRKEFFNFKAWYVFSPDDCNENKQMYNVTVANPIVIQNS
jgi:hypothetical protein